MNDIQLQAVARTPSSALGTSREELRGEDLERIFSVFQRRGVRYLFYTGGNGSMGAAARIATHAKALGHEFHVIGIPKTIDNDLDGTDHTPGYATGRAIFRMRGARYRSRQPVLGGPGGIYRSAGAQRGLASRSHGARKTGARRCSALNLFSRGAAAR